MTTPTPRFSASFFGLVIAAGGSSTRFGGGDKLSIDFHGLPLLCHCLKNLMALDTPTVVVAHETHLATYRSMVAEHLPGLVSAIHFVQGGSTRAESVYHGYRRLLELTPSPEVIASHDAARPCCSREMLLKCVDIACQTGAAIAAHRVTDTIHVCTPDGKLQTTPERSTLWAAETPQVFATQLLTQAYTTLPWQDISATDEAGLVARLPGITIQMVENFTPNPKITYHHDVQ